MHLGRSRKTICVAVLLALIGLLAVPRGLVLCVGDAGHVSIEAAVEMAPCQLVGDDTRFPSESPESCDDTTLTSKVLESARSLEVVWALIAILAPAPRPPAALQPPLPSSTNPSASSLWLREHRTIVLLV